MKRNFKKHALRLAMVSVFTIGAATSVNSTAANSATADATATVIAPIAITKTANLRFGTFAAGASTGTVVMTAAGARSATGGVVLSALDAGGAASFDVTGDTTATYAITLPADGVITITDGTTPMNVDTFTSNPSGTGLLTAGAQTLTVGGTLDVAISQAAGAYTGTFDVIVQYN